MIVKPFLPCLFVLVLSSCASRSYQWTKQTALYPKSVEFCQAKAAFNFSDGQNSIAAPIEIEVFPNGAQSQARIYFLNPFGLREAMLELTPRRKRLFRNAEMLDVKKDPIAAQWLHPLWWDEIEFLINLKRDSTNSQSFVDPKRRARKYHSKFSEILCRYPSESSYERCTVTRKQSEAVINFTFLKCG